MLEVLVIGNILNIAKSVAQVLSRTTDFSFMPFALASPATLDELQ